MVNYSEYNKVYRRKGDALYSFVKCLDHAVQKSGAYEAVMHQLKCIGWSEELLETAIEAAKHYKGYHRIRIRNEQEQIKTSSSGDIVYPVVLEYKPPAAERVSVMVAGVASSADEARADMQKISDDTKRRFKDELLDAFPGESLTFEATAFDDRYEMRLDGSNADAYFRVWVGKSVFL